MKPSLWNWRGLIINIIKLDQTAGWRSLIINIIIIIQNLIQKKSNNFPLKQSKQELEEGEKEEETLSTVNIIIQQTRIQICIFIQIFNQVPKISTKEQNLNKRTKLSVKPKGPKLYLQSSTQNLKTSTKDSRGRDVAVQRVDIREGGCRESHTIEIERDWGRLGMREENEMEDSQKGVAGVLTGVLEGRWFLEKRLQRCREQRIERRWQMDKMKGNRRTEQP